MSQLESDLAASILKEHLRQCGDLIHKVLTEAHYARLYLDKGDAGFIAGAAEVYKQADRETTTLINDHVAAITAVMEKGEMPDMSVERIALTKRAFARAARLLRLLPDEPSDEALSAANAEGADVVDRVKKMFEVLKK